MKADAIGAGRGESPQRRRLECSTVLLHAWTTSDSDFCWHWNQRRRQRGPKGLTAHKGPGPWTPLASRIRRLLCAP